MNPNPVITPDEQNVVGFSESPGRRLRVQRQSRGIEIERIAAQLHLRVPAVEALEQDRYQDLPGPVFIAGYLRNYARLVGLDPEPLLAAFRAINPDPDADRLPVGPLPRPELGSGHILVRLISLALLAAVVATLVLWWQNRAELLFAATPAAPPPLPAESVPAAGPLPAATGAAGTAFAANGTAEPAAPSASTQAAVSSPAPLPSLTPPLSQAPSEPVTAPAPVPARAAAESTGTPTPAVDPQEVALKFSGSTWINVRDAGGATVLAGDMRPGDTRVLGGRPPYSVAVGRAGALAITIGGQPFAPKARIQGGTARFKLDPGKPQ